MIGILVAIVLLIPCALALWVYFSPFGIPDVKHLQVLAPTERTQANFPDCGGSATATAIPGIEMGRFRDALIAAEGDPRNEATFRETARLFLPHQYPKRQASYSAHLAQRLNCPPANWIEHEIKTIRTAVQIERRFKPDDILTIVSNSVYFGKDLWNRERFESLLQQESDAIIGGRSGDLGCVDSSARLLPEAPGYRDREEESGARRDAAKPFGVEQGSRGSKERTPEASVIEMESFPPLL
jgi:hypothetical protein